MTLVTVTALFLGAVTFAVASSVLPASTIDPPQAIVTQRPLLTSLSDESQDPTTELAESDSPALGDTGTQPSSDSPAVDPTAPSSEQNPASDSDSSDSDEPQSEIVNGEGTDREVVAPPVREHDDDDDDDDESVEDDEPDDDDEYDEEDD
mgnify:CR=1 FL=1